jgi:hypothetical protein
MALPENDRGLEAAGVPSGGGLKTIPMPVPYTEIKSPEDTLFEFVFTDTVPSDPTFRTDPGPQPLASRAKIPIESYPA